MLSTEDFVKKKIISLFDWTVSLQVCHGFSDKVYLSIAGDEPDYPNAFSDFLDVTEIYIHKKEFSESNQKKILSFKNRKKIKKRKFEDLV